MLDLKLIRQNPETVREGLEAKRVKLDLQPLLALDEQRRILLQESENLKAERNQANQEIAAAKSTGGPAPELIARMKEISARIKALDPEVQQLEDRLQQLLLTIPNLPHASVPRGASEADNREVRRWGEPREFAYEPRAHWEIGEQLGILDLERAAKLAGSGFVAFVGAGARLERALISFMLDLHVDRHGYTEIFPPFVVNREAMTGTGQLPKMEEDMYHCRARRPVPDPHRRGAGHQPPPRRDPRGRPAADLLHRLHPLLPPRGRQLRQGHPRADPRPPVRQGGDGQVRRGRRPPTTSWRAW